MDGIRHSFVDVRVRGLKIHIAEIGSGPAVLFVHGFPEIWYSWRHQMLAAAAAGFRAIAPDARGYGLSEKPPEPHKTSFKDLVDDILALIDEIDLKKILLVGKDFGARVVYHFALLHPNRLTAVATIGTPFMLAGPAAFPKDKLPTGFYMLRWQEPLRAEKDFARFDVQTVIKNIYILFSGSELPVANADQEIMDLVHPTTPFPPWLTQHDLDIYASLYEKSGFETPLQVPYRAWLEDYGVDEVKVKVPCLLIVGEKDYAMKFAGLEDYIRNGAVKQYVPDLEIEFLPFGTHFAQEQLPLQVNNLLIPFFSKHLPSF